MAALDRQVAGGFSNPKSAIENLKSRGFTSTTERLFYTKKF
jgi:hypothetical protein